MRKTTCLRLAAEVPTKGRVTVAGQEVNGPGPDRAVVFQQFALFPWKSVAENIAFGLRNQAAAASTLQQRICAIIRLMGLGGYETAYPTSSRVECNSASPLPAPMCWTPKRC